MKLIVSNIYITKMDFVIVTCIILLCMYPQGPRIALGNVVQFPICSSTQYLNNMECVNHCPPFKLPISNGFANLCVNDHDIFTCPVGTCQNLCYKFQCVDMCPHHTFDFNSSCLEKCPKEANFITTNGCEDNCFFSNKTCHKVCPEPYSYQLLSPFFTWCLKKCPVYTNVNNFTCELQCSSEKPYLFNNTCTETCPDNDSLTYVHSSKFNVILMCTDHCGGQVLYQNRCLPRCPKLTVLHNGTCMSSCPSSYPYFYSTELRHRSDVSMNQSDLVCVLDCGSQYNIYNSTCVAKCPNSAPFAEDGTCKVNCTSDKPFYKEDSKTCLSSCPMGYWYFNDSNLCYDVCPFDFLYKFNQTCFSECPATHPFIKHSSSSIVFLKNGTSLTIPDYECVDDCPYFNYQNKCIFYCPANVKYKYNKTCVSECNGDLPYHLTTRTNWFYKEEYTCVSACPMFVVKHSSICASTCPSDALYLYNNTCVARCPLSKKYALKRTSYYECISDCPKLSVHNVCVENCPDNAKYISGSVCLSICNGSMPYHFINTTTIRRNYYDVITQTNYYCLERCPKNLFVFDFRCIHECPKTTFRLQEKCLFECPSTFQYIIISEQKCTEVCPENTYVFNRTCVSVCPDKHFQFQNICISKCPKTHFSYTQNIIPGKNRYYCVDICPNSSYILQQNNSCFDFCPYPLHIDGWECVISCPSSRQYLNNITNECTMSCNDLYMHLNICVDICPEETFASKNVCVSDCPKSHSFKYIANKQTPTRRYCVQQCPRNASKLNETCIDECPQELFLDEKQCVKSCPHSRLLVDSTTNSCTANCPKNLVLTFSNKCDTKCPAERTFIENGTCILSCPIYKRLYYPVKNGFLCTNSCSSNFVEFEETSLCQATCPYNRVIKDGVCKLHGKCENHHFIEHTSKGTVCNNKCPENMYQNGKDCVYMCPMNLYGFNKTCVEECPKIAPYVWKTFGMTVFPKCLTSCPFFTVINETTCIPEEECVGFFREKEYAVHNGICVKACPSGTLRFKDSSCQKIALFVVPIVLCFIMFIVCLVSVIKMASWKCKANRQQGSLNDSNHGLDPKENVYVNESIEVSDGMEETELEVKQTYTGHINPSMEINVGYDMI